MPPTRHGWARAVWEHRRRTRIQKHFSSYQDPECRRLRPPNLLERGIRFDRSPPGEHGIAFSRTRERLVRRERPELAHFLRRLTPNAEYRSEPGDRRYAPQSANASHADLDGQIYTNSGKRAFRLNVFDRIKESDGREQLIAVRD